MKNLLKLFLSLMLIICLFGCSKKTDTDDIIIIYTNDVHCGIDDSIGFAGLKAYVDEAKTHSSYVTLVDAGDQIQGSSLASVSKGKAIVECLQEVGYDILSFGNHEFDYGYKYFSDLIQESNLPYINSNVYYSGNDESVVFNKLDSYKIMEYGQKKVAFIALLTPNTYVDTAPTNLKENGETVINFTYGKDSSEFYNETQSLIDKCRNEEKVDYVICLSHMGSGEAYSPYSTGDLAVQTSGIDVIIDAHGHDVNPSTYLTNKNGEEVIVTSSGTKLSNIGQVVISADGYIFTTNITSYPNKDEALAAKISEIKDKYSSELEKTLFTNDTLLTINDENGVRMVRSKETNMGDLSADAFRYVTQADITLLNGGGVRADIKVGNVTFNDLINIHPFGNWVSAIEMTGQEILDWLEYGARFTQINCVKDGKNICEYGTFMQVSGLKYTINTSITSDVIVDENDMLLSVGESRRISDVLIENDNGEYEPIDPSKTYVVAGTNYSLLEGGSGSEIFLADHKVVINDAGLDYLALYTYIAEGLNFDLSSYANVAGRITIK